MLWMSSLSKSTINFLNWWLLQMFSTASSILSALPTTPFRSAGQLANSLPGGGSSYEHLWKAIAAILELGCWLAVSELWGASNLCMRSAALPCRDQAPTVMVHMWVKIRSATAWLNAPHSTWGRFGWSIRSPQTQISKAEALRGGGLSTSIHQRWTFWYKGPQSWLWPASEFWEHLQSWSEILAWSPAAKR